MPCCISTRASLSGLEESSSEITAPLPGGLAHGAKASPHPGTPITAQKCVCTHRCITSHADVAHSGDLTCSSFWGPEVWVSSASTGRMHRMALGLHGAVSAGLAHIWRGALSPRDLQSQAPTLPQTQGHGGNISLNGYPWESLGL